MAHVLKCLIPTIGSPRTLHGKEGRYELAAFYCELLGMKVVYEPWLLIADGSGSAFYIAFDGDGWDDRRPPRWPDPDYPQQMHLDIGVPDVDAAGERVTVMGATLLTDNGSFRVYADPVGHPFCLYPDMSTDHPVVRRLVFDCFSPRLLASFYEGFLQARGRIEDAPERVVIALDDDLPDLGFQHAQFRAARWPDPAYPSQVHVDYRWHDHLTGRRALQRAQRLGAIRLPHERDTEIYADPASHPFCIQNEIPRVFAVSGLYLNPPEYAVVYCVDEKAQNPLDDSQSQPPPCVPDEHTVDDQLDLDGIFGAVDVAHAKTDAQRRCTDFQAFLTEVDAEAPSNLAVNLVCDWDSTFESPAVQTWLADRPRFQVHRNPPGVEWRLQAESWLAYVADELTGRGDDGDALALESAVRSWVQAWTDDSEPFVWTRTADQVVTSLERLVLR
jgi:Glyoxalase-like domain